MESGRVCSGYTNLLMVLLMSLIMLFFSKTTSVLIIQILGIVFLLIIACLNMLISEFLFSFRNEGHRKLTKVLAFLCGLFYYPLLYWSLMGMETGLLCALLLAGMYFGFKYVQSRNFLFLFLFAVFSGLAFLTRNDSIIFFFVLWVYICAESAWQSKQSQILRELFASLGVYFLFIAGQLSFQNMYYGEMLPNTYVLKMTGMPLVIRLQNGFGFILPYLREVLMGVLMSVTGLFIDWHKEKIVLFSLFGVSVLYQIYVGGDPWNYWRIMAPSMPLLLLLCVNAAWSLSERFWILVKPLINFPTGSVVIALMSLCLAAVNFRFLQEITLQVAPYLVDRNARSVNTAIALNDILQDKATIGVFWAGTLPYYVDNRAIDFLGKSDSYIAHLPPDVSGSVSFNGMMSVPGHNKYDLVYSIVGLKPTYVQRFFWGRQSVFSMVGGEYIEVQYRYMTLYLQKNSPYVNWEKLKLP